MKKIFTRKKIIILVLILIAGAVIFKLATNKNSVQEITANVNKLERKTIEEIISVKAPLDGIEKADVVSPLNYEIVDILVKEGDLVKKDQVLAVLDSEELKKEIASVESQIELASLEQRDRLRAAQIEYDKALLQLGELEESYNQNKELYENGIITEEAFKKSESSLTDMRKSMESFNVVDGKAVISPAEQKRTEIQMKELNQKKEDLSKVYIKSPIDGTVTRVNVNIGRYAKDNSSEKAMFLVENVASLQMKVLISEFDIGKIKVGQEAEIYSDILGQNFVKGIVSRVSPTAEQKELNSMERVIPVLIEVVEKPDDLIAGVIANARIKVNKSENVFAVPTGAILEDENSENKIFVVNDDNTLKSIAVKIGLETDLETEVTSSELTEGMRVVVNPDVTFTDGMAVKPNDGTDEVKE